MGGGRVTGLKGQRMTNTPRELRVGGGQTGQTQVDSRVIMSGKGPCSSVQEQILIFQDFGMLPRGKFLTNLRDEC